MGRLECVTCHVPVKDSTDGILKSGFGGTLETEGGRMTMGEGCSVIIEPSLGKFIVTLSWMYDSRYEIQAQSEIGIRLLAESVDDRYVAPTFSISDVGAWARMKQGLSAPSICVFMLQTRILRGIDSGHCEIYLWGDCIPESRGNVTKIMDIDDILADLERAEPISPESTALDHQQLTRFWISERAAPDILRWPSDLMDRVMSRVRKQIEAIEDLTAGVGMNGSGTVSSNSNLALSILQTDLSRTQYIVRSLLRQRLAKLTRYAMHYLTMDDKGTLLSPQEQSFLQNHQALLSNFYGASFLSAFPPQLQRLDENTGGLNMVEGPDGKTAVFVRCLAERWSSDPAYEDYDDDDDDDGGEASDGLAMRRGQVWVVRWEDVRKGVNKGALELL